MLFSFVEKNGEQGGVVDDYYKALRSSTISLKGRGTLIGAAAIFCAIPSKRAAMASADASRRARRARGAWSDAQGAVGSPERAQRRVAGNGDPAGNGRLEHGGESGYACRRAEPMAGAPTCRGPESAKDVRTANDLTTGKTRPRRARLYRVSPRDLRDRVIFLSCPSWQAAPNPAKQRAGVGGAMRPLMIIFWLPLRFGAPFRKARAGGAVDGPADSGGLPRVSSGHVLSETAGARGSFSKETPLNSHPRRGRSGGLHRRGRPSFRPAAGFRPEGACGSNHLSGGGLRPAPGTGASRRDRPFRRSGAACARGGVRPANRRKHRG